MYLTYTKTNQSKLARFYFCRSKQHQTHFTKQCYKYNKHTRCIIHGYIQAQALYKIDTLIKPGNHSLEKNAT